MCTAFEVRRDRPLAMMLFADEVPIIPAGSKPDDTCGLSSFACPCSLGSAFTPYAPSPYTRGCRQITANALT
jgi:hypothetical protein